ncbi:hypothetical protein K2X05_14605 [bacterium]|nr:hypothetical protein [bacterium]
MVLFILALSYFGFSEPQVVVAALAKVGNQVITSRDLQIHLFLNETYNPLVDFVDRKEPLKDLTHEHLIVMEAESLLVVKVEDAEVKQTTEKVLKKLQNDALWKSLQVSPNEVQQQMRRKILVRQILNLKMPKDLISIGDEAVDSYYMQNRNQLGQKPLVELREKIVQILKTQKNQERFRDWMSTLSRTHGVIYYSGYKIQ